MPAPEVVRDLVKRFEENLDSYRSSRYNETQLRREFLDPLFEALGWDVFNKQGYAEAYKDVIHEDSLEVEGATKAPDYAFRIGGGRKFFVEAKKPSVRIETDIHPAFQLRRYSWSAKLPIGVLSDFEEFAVYESRSKPNKKDKASTGRVAFYKFTEYVEKWDEIAGIFSREAVLKGSFDKFAEGVKRKKGTAEVDDAFLEEIEHWRELLAKNIAIRNPDLNVRELNYAVQMTIDRIIFLRICEDRGIEPYGRLKDIALTPSFGLPSPSGRGGGGEGVYAELCRIFQQADARYNSGLFHFKEEKDAGSAADSLTLSLNVDDKVLKEILGSLYYPESPYVFSEIPSDILGQVYERFLGKVIRLTAGHQAKVEEKPEVRKAGGVYYTPTYIVEYIVKNTVGKLLDGERPEGSLEKDSVDAHKPSGRSLTPKDVSRLKILDPACGSGTFPLGAYQYLLDWHLKWYMENDPEKWAKGKSPVIFESDKGWMLTTSEKKRILLNNIYGVDIDPQAVEVTKLSLLLKVLEGESEETIGSQLSLIQERALPDLGDNIKCGNSLIGPDYYQGQQLTMGFADEEERYRVNAFDWKTEFSQVFTRSEGGFDVVIGNPPYVRQEVLGEEFKAYAKNRYLTYAGTADLFVYFIEHSHNILRADGIFSFIVASKWMRANYGKSLRNWLKKQNIEEIIDFGDLPVFENATTYPCILRLSKKPLSKSFRVVQVKNLEFRNLADYVSENQYEIDQSSLSDDGWSLATQSEQALLTKLYSVSTPLGQYVDGRIFYGVKTGFNEAFVIDQETRERLIQEHPSSDEIIKPFLAGRDIKRYEPVPEGRFVIFTRRGVDIKKYPAIYRYLSQFKERLMPKPKNWKGNEWKGRKPGSYEWYEIQDTVDYYLEFEKPKIIVPAIVQSASYAFDRNKFYSNDKTSIIGVDDLYLLGVLNSKVPDFVMRSISSTKQGGYFEYKPMYLEQLPIRTINFSDAEDKARHDKIVSLVERMLELHKSPSARTPGDKERVKREIESTDRQIDRLVYELYGLSEDEVKVVEGN